MPEHLSANRVNTNTGILFLMLGAVVSCLIFADRWTSLSIDFPSAWYRSRNFHLLIAVSFYIAGWRAFRNAKVTIKRPNTTHPVFETVTLYTRESCELCDRAMFVLAEHSEALPRINVVDIDRFPELFKQHSQSVPVVEIDGRIRFRGAVSRVLLQRLIDAHQRSQRVGRNSNGGDSKGQGG